MFGFTPKRHGLSGRVQKAVVAAIRDAEAKTTGEIRVFVEGSCAYLEPMERAQEIFQDLQMRNTERRNAVLLYLAMDDRQFAVFGDEQIFQKAGGPEFWKQAAINLQASLRDGKIETGICNCVAELGEALAHHFPFDPAIARNELPDEIVFGK